MHLIKKFKWNLCNCFKENRWKFWDMKPTVNEFLFFKKVIFKIKTKFSRSVRIRIKMVSEGKKRGKASATSPVKPSAVVPAPVRLTKDEIFNVR